ncbi:MAG: ERCC4 domain-containing protein [Candidatus Micrarchaeia archaeon]
MQTSLQSTAPSAARQDKQVEISMDSREPAQYREILEGLGASVPVKTLQVGDYLASARCAIERKTRQDFEASLVDGRLFAQAKNMLESYERPVLVVEGRPNPSSGVSKNAVLGAYACLVCDYGMSVFFVKSPEAFCRLVYSFARYEQKGRGKALPVYAKKKALSLDKMQLAVLESMPLIGPKYARLLLVHFGTLKNALNASRAELMQVKGLGEKRATIISNLLEAPYAADEKGQDA